MDYQGTIFGDLLVPYFELHEDTEKPYSHEEVICRPIFFKGAEETFEIPDLNVKRLKDELVKTKEKEAYEATPRRTFFDGPMVRLKNYFVDDEAHTLNLELQRTSFFTFAATNKSLDNPEVRRMIDERGGSAYTNLNDGLANPIGVNVVLISKPDNAIIMTKRSEKLSQYPGLYGIPAGFMSAEKDRRLIEDNSVLGVEYGSTEEKFVYDPFLTAIREPTEEVAKGIILDSVAMMGNGKACDDRHTEFQMIAETPWTVEKILAAPKSSKWEHEKIFGVSLEEPKEIMGYLTKTIKEEPKGVPKDTGTWVPGRSPEWVPAHWKAVNSVAINKLGFDEVWSAYEETRKK